MRLFGTDGIRGKFGSEPITPQTILKLGWALGSVLNERSEDRCEVIVGKDTRVSGYVLESALTGGLLSAGVDIALLGPVSTPAVSYFSRVSRASAGVVISASHNPVQDNGIKVFLSNGLKISASMERRVEARLDGPIQVVDAHNLGKARRIDNPVEQYVGYLFSNAPSRLDGLRIVIDCANGASYKIGPMLLSQLGADVVSVADTPSGFNINLNCGSTNPEYIRNLTLEHHADIGIALDGDGDRVVMVDAAGNLINGDQILYIIAVSRKRKGMLRGGVVGTHLSNMGLRDTLQAREIPFECVEVGDRFISERLRELNWNLGGEECGHILNGEAGIPGDGLIAAMEVLAEVIESGKTLKELAKELTLVPKVTRNVPLRNQNSPIKGIDASHWPRTTEAVDVARKELDTQGRILLRASGTEPAIRILVEGYDADQIGRIADRLSNVVDEESESATALA
ncbi:MAG: phosphoglucosamine mutase [Acidiferrobacterales bacterium]|nr:phosphoglucosamine mutase [Acidiferrobacterales bacterium]